MQEQKIVTPRRNYRYPDVTVDCGARQAMADLAAAEPRVVFEVESPSNTAIDEFERFVDYQSALSIQQIVIVSQSSARAHLHAHWRGLAR
jgi:Uma2 family endonuclease